LSATAAEPHIAISICHLQSAICNLKSAICKEQSVGSVKKWRKKKIAKHKHRKRLKATRFQRRKK